MTLLRGHDISAYQGSTAPSVDFVIVKATEGESYTSSRFAAQYASAKNKARHRGAYHFARPEESSAASQAARFLAVVKPVPGESVWLDLEVSDLNQAQTNAWARSWGEYIRAHAPGVTSGVYLGAGYVSNNTGRDLSRYFDLWWYPQYPTAFLTKWPTSVSPWLPGTNNTGWSKPHIWQFSDRLEGLDANVTALTAAELGGTSSEPSTPVSAPPKPWPGRYLKYDKGALMHGADVKWAQERLNKHGARPALKADGEFGKLTRDAVEAYQGAHGLTRDGVVGKHTWDSLAK